MNRLDALPDHALVTLAVDHPRGSIRFIAASMTWVDRTGPCLSCLWPTSGACGYEFPHAAHRSFLCRKCLDLLQRGDPNIAELAMDFGEVLGNYPWVRTCNIPEESRHADYRCRWTGRRCRRVGWWQRGEFRAIAWRNGRLLDATGKETGELVPAGEFAW